MSRTRSCRVLGIMSGTSVDSVDYALCDVAEQVIKLVEYWQVAFPKELRKRIVAVARGEASSYETGQLHHDLGRFYATGALRGSGAVQLIGLHGQTIFHNPSRRAPATLQIGEPAWLVEALNVPVVSNFRAGDLAAGGEGAPLATLFHLKAFARRGQHVCINNLGGISNVTSIDWRSGNEPSVLAFDTGPANVLIDAAIESFTDGRQRFDRDGRWASRGKVDAEALTRLLKEPFFRRSPPKSTGRELFSQRFLDEAVRRMRQRRLNEQDIIATLTELTAASLALNYRLHLASPPDRVILAGGGAANLVLKSRIETHLRELNANVRVTTCSDLGWPIQAVEPAAFALLAWCRVNGIAGNLPQTTGARHGALLGQISEPLNVAAKNRPRK